MLGSFLLSNSILLIIFNINNNYNDFYNDIIKKHINNGVILK